MDALLDAVLRLAADPQQLDAEAEFVGIGDLTVIYESLEDGAELAYTRHVVSSREESERFVRERKDLTVFAPILPVDGPDYSAKDIVDMVGKLPS